jgi:ABC-type nickel/cobalt efflux system permease component RcnA
VISAYVLANEKTVRRGIKLSFLAAFIQALSAIAIVGLLAILMKATSLQMKTAEQWIETLSWALVAGVGAWLLYGQLKPLLARRSGAKAQAHVHADGSVCTHAHHHEHHGHQGNHKHDHHGHHHGHAHDEACCGHAHMPAPKDLEGPLDWRKSLALATSVGIRPCTGAILVLIFALSQGLFWAGVFATFAMALGTAITVSALAALAVGSRELATRMAGSDSLWASRIATAAGIGGSALVFIMGTAFFFASLKGSGPF